MTLTRNDLTLYERNAEHWWDANAPAFRSLHSVNRFRVELLAEWLGLRLDGCTVVDLGCGGGLLSEPLQRRGARVLGVDLSWNSLRTARGKLGPRLVVGDALRAPLRERCADVVLLADVLEHVEDPLRALREASRITRPGGFVYVNTINRTTRAKWLAVHLAEGVGLVPRGTHDPRLFVRPSELREHAAACGLRVVALQGEKVDLRRTFKYWAIALQRGDDCSVGYSAMLRKEGAA